MTYVHNSLLLQDELEEDGKEVLSKFLAENRFEDARKGRDGLMRC